MEVTISHIRSSMDGQTKKILTDHHVTPEQYLAWLMHDARPVKIPVWVVASISLGGGLILILSLSTSNAVPWDVKLFLLGLGTSASLAIIFGLTSWTMRHAHNPIGEKMLMLGALRKLSRDYLATLNASDWKNIAEQKPFIEDKRTQKSDPRQERLKPFQKRFGWAAILFGIGYFVVSASYQFLSLPLFLFSFGGWMAVKGARITFEQNYKDLQTGLVVSGAPAKAAGIVGIVFGSLVALLGLLATILWLLGKPIG